jgi:hypothetical protein
MHQRSFGVGSLDSTPSSPLMAGVDHIPCGPAPPGQSFSPHAPSSPLSISPRPAGLHGGGVEALRLSRAGSLGTSLPSSPGPNASFPANAAAAPGPAPAASASGANTNGTATPYGNLSLAAATYGAGAPGALTPPNVSAGLLASAIAMEEKEREKDKERKKGLYPSRVVLTSE